MEIEMKRKVVHIGNGLWTLIIGILPRIIALCITIIAFILGFFIFRPNSKFSIGKKAFNAMARDIDHKKGFLYGPTVYIIMVNILIAFIDYRIAAASFAVLAFGDGFAAVVGIKLGKHRIHNEKSLEGTLAFIFASFIFGSFIFLLVDFLMWPDASAGLSLIPVLIVDTVYKSNLTLYFPLILALMLAVSIITALIELYTPQDYIDDNISIPFVTSLILWLGMKFIFPIFVVTNT